MRRSLLAAASLAALAAAPALGQVTVDTERTTPITTGEANNGAASNVVINTNGRVRLNRAAGPAVRVNSNNDLTIQNGAQVEISDTDGSNDTAFTSGATGVQVDAGVDSDMIMAGTIQLGDTYNAVDSTTDDRADYNGDGTEDADSEADGAFSNDANKTGVLFGNVNADGTAVAGQPGITGSATFESTARVTVAGQDSYGVRTVADLSGSLLMNGAIGIRGEDSVGLSVEGNVGGDMEIGTINSANPGGAGAEIDGNVGGGLRIRGTIDVSGYRVTSRVTEEIFRRLDIGDDDLDSRGAVIVRGSVEDGVFVAAGGIVAHNSGEGAALAITAPSNRDITIGEAVLPDNFDTARTDDDTNPTPLGASIANEGTIRSAGVYDGKASTAFLIAGFDDNGVMRMVVLTQGISNSGAINATAFDANATAMRIGPNVTGANGGRFDLVNSGEILATAARGYAADGFAENQRDQGRAHAIVLDANSSLRRLLNQEGSIVARVFGGGAGATAITVNGDALQEITNTGVIAALSGNLEESFTGEVELIAIDARSNTAGLRITQTETIKDGKVVREAGITGDILLGSGADTLELRGGEVVGDVAFGDGADQLIIDGATLSGAVTDSDGRLVVDVKNGRLLLQGSDSLRLTDASFGQDGVLEIRVDRTRSTAFIDASGQVSFNAGSELSVSLANLIGESAELAIVTADGGLAIDSDASIEASETPFLYTAAIARSAADPDTLVLTLQRKSVDQLGLQESRAAAWTETLATMEAVDALGSAFAALRTQDEFLQAYDQLLPEYAASSLQFAVAANDAAAGALSTRLRNSRLAPDDLAGVWAQEFAYYADRSGSAFGPGYRGQGVGLAIGLDRPLGPFYAVGFNILGAASEVEEISGFDQPLVALTGQIGTYAGLDLGGFDVSGALALGYDYFESERSIVIGDFSSANTADWSGWHVSAAAQAGRDFVWNNWVVRPEAALTYISMFESGYTESVEDAANARLGLIVDDRESATLLAAATVSVSRRFGSDASWWAPSLHAGYRGDLLDEISETRARFGETGGEFTLRGNTLTGSGALVGVGFSAGSNYSTFTFAYDADIREDFVRHVARLVIRLTF